MTLKIEGTSSLNQIQLTGILWCIHDIAGEDSTVITLYEYTGAEFWKEKKKNLRLKVMP